MRQLSPDLSSKMSQNLQTIGNNANPNMEVTVTRAKSTVQDSTYWTVETIREISGLGDVSVAPQRLKTHGGPSRIYEIHVRDGQVYTSIREYPDKFREGFKTQFELGPGSSVGLAFNGHWERYRKFYRLITEEKPWVFWVDGQGDLYTRHWDEKQDYWEYPDPIVEMEETDIWDGTYQNNMSVNASGILTTFTGCRTTNKVPVVAGQTYIFDNGTNGNYGRLRWVDDNNGYVHHQDLGPNAGSAIAPVGAKGVYFFYVWDVVPMPEPRILLQITTEVPQEPIWKEQMDRKLAEGVKCCKAIRGWKNLVIQHQDHGIIVGYIKNDGKVYYRNYCIQEDGSEAWEYERELTSFTGVATNINLFITNDYRSGFIIEDSLGKIHWLVTHRNWGGMASPVENINTSIRDIRFEVIPIKYHDFKIEEKIDVGISNLWFNVAEPIYPIPIFAENPDEQPDKILIRFNYPIDVDPTIVKNAFTIRDADNKTYNIISSQFGADATEITFNTARFDSAKNDMTIVYNRNIVELDALNQGSRFAVNSFSFIFSVVVTPPQGFTEEHLGFSILPRFEVTQVYHTPVYTTETVMTGIANISIVVTKVGENPL